MFPAHSYVSVRVCLSVQSTCKCTAVCGTQTKTANVSHRLGSLRLYLGIPTSSSRRFHQLSQGASSSMQSKHLPFAKISRSLFPTSSNNQAPTRKSYLGHIEAPLADANKLMSISTQSRTRRSTRRMRLRSVRSKCPWLPSRTGVL